MLLLSPTRREHHAVGPGRPQRAAGCAFCLSGADGQLPGALSAAVRGQRLRHAHLLGQGKGHSAGWLAQPFHWLAFGPGSVVSVFSFVKWASEILICLCEPDSIWKALKPLGTVGRRPLIFGHKLSFPFTFSVPSFSAAFTLGPKRLLTSPVCAHACVFSSLFFQNTLPIAPIGSGANLIHPQQDRYFLSAEVVVKSRTETFIVWMMQFIVFTNLEPLEPGLNHPEKSFLSW